LSPIGRPASVVILLFSDIVTPSADRVRRGDLYIQYIVRIEWIGISYRTSKWNFTSCRYFCAMADSGGFSRAARLTHVSQPSLSQQIHKLEEELGAQLFDRIGRTVRLTELGRAFLPRARALLSDLEAARSAVVEGSTSITGSVCVVMTPLSRRTFSLRCWLHFLADIRKRA
jgi:DNA-binding transcriptional LysR family regulator